MARTKSLDLEAFITGSPEFSEFDASEILLLSQTMLVTSHPDGTVFIRQGERGDAMFFLLKGTVLVGRKYAESSAEEYVERLEQGAMFGLVSLIDNGDRAATCCAQGDVVVGALPRNAFNLLCNANTTLAQKFQMLIARQLARDLRVYNRALSHMMAHREHAGFFGALRAASYEYRGIERRKTERRSESDRRQCATVE